MSFFKKLVDALNKVSGILEYAVNVICVFCLSLQTALICFQVFGRYLFKYIPPGLDELALLCMVWMALLGFCLNVRDDSHLKMELVDLIVTEDKIKYFQLFSSVLTVVFSIYMIKYGIRLWRLRVGTYMATIKMSNAWYYIVVPISGVLIAFSGLVFFFNTVLKIIQEPSNGKKSKIKGYEALREKELKEAQGKNE